MEMKKLIRKDLADWIYYNQDTLHYRINKQNADRIARLFIVFFQEKLAQGYKIEIRGFGTFFVKTLKSTVKTILGRGLNNPKGKKIIIKVKERKNVKFIPSTILRGYVNEEMPMV